MPKKNGRPSFAPQYTEIMRKTPKGEVAVVGMIHKNNQAFASYQAAQHHQKSIIRALGNSGGKASASIICEPGAIETTTYDADEGHYVTTLHKGYYLVLKGRG